jgi:competence protein ComEA
MMNRSEARGSTGGAILLLFFLLALHLLKGVFSQFQPARNPCEEKAFVQVSGHINHPGVYGFCHPPSLNDLLIRAQGPIPKTEKQHPFADVFYNSGVNVDVRNGGKELHVFEGEMSSFYKITFRIPLSLNKESIEGLTAVPGIGPKTARAIVQWRAKKGGFQSLDEILAVPGIGPKLFSRAAPYLAL